MTESDARPSGQTAGAMLRAAREKQGLHVAALAAALKVPPRKLEALEADRYDELPDPAFARALAQSVCRVLRIDARPVLELLPRPDAASLEQVAGTLNTPFRDRGSRDDAGFAGAAIRPLLLASAVLMLAAIVLWLLPSSLWDASAPPAPAASEPAASEAAAPVAWPAPAASVAADPTAASSPLMSPVGAASAPMAVPASAAALPQVPAPSLGPAPALAAPVATASAVAVGAVPSGALRVAVTGTSWVEVQDARGQIVFSRTLQAGESAAVDGTAPLRLVIGNAGVTTLTWRGRPVDLAAVARSNVARLELP